MDAAFDALGFSPEEKRVVSGLVDRRGKMEPSAWDVLSVESGLTPSQLTGLKDLLTDTEAWRRSEELVRLFAALEALGVADYVRFDPNIMRGLLYYTGTVFEAFDITGSVRRAILGGGRYDNLLADVGGEAICGVGFAMGDVVLSIVLSELGLMPKALGVNRSSVLVTVFSRELHAASLKLSSDLRQSGLNVTCYPEAVKLPKQFKFADRMGMRVVLVLGPDEVAQAKVAVKNLGDGTQEIVDRGALPASVRRILSGS
jgi:histidyl-tRNA synthetase